MSHSDKTCVLCYRNEKQSVSLHALFRYFCTHNALSMVLKELLIQVLMFWHFGVSGATVFGPGTHLRINKVTENL